MLEGNLRGLQHIGLPVTNMARSVAFYRRLGFAVTMERTLDGESGPVPVTMLELGGLVLELYQPAGPDADALRARGDGHLDHVALDVRDVERAFDNVRAAGLSPLEDAPIFLPFWEHGVRYFNVRGPDGEKIEFNERLR